VLTDNYARAVAKFIDLPFSTIAGCAGTSLNIVPNDWSVVETRLKARGVL
jgi:hypothetical protein